MCANIVDFRYYWDYIITIGSSYNARAAGACKSRSNRSGAVTIGDE